MKMGTTWIETDQQYMGQEIRGIYDQVWLQTNGNGYMYLHEWQWLEWDHLRYPCRR